MLPNRAHRARQRRLGVRRHDANDVVRSDADGDRARIGETFETVAIDVGDQVAEAIDAEDLAGDLRSAITGVGMSSS